MVNQLPGSLSNPLKLPFLPPQSSPPFSCPFWSKGGENQTSPPPLLPSSPSTRPPPVRQDTPRINAPALRTPWTSWARVFRAEKSGRGARRAALRASGGRRRAIPSAGCPRPSSEVFSGFWEEIPCDEESWKRDEEQKSELGGFTAGSAAPNTERHATPVRATAWPSSCPSKSA